MNTVATSTIRASRTASSSVARSKPGARTSSSGSAATYIRADPATSTVMVMVSATRTVRCPLSGRPAATARATGGMSPRAMAPVISPRTTFIRPWATRNASTEAEAPNTAAMTASRPNPST